MTQHEFVNKCLMYWLPDEVPRATPDLDFGDCLRLAAQNSGSRRGNLEGAARELDSYTPPVREILKLMIAEGCL